MGLAGLAWRVATLDRGRMQAEIERRLGDALGREVRAERLGFALGWNLRIGADGLRVSAVPGSPDTNAPPLLEAKRVDLELRALPLLRGRVDVEGIVLRDATLHLDREGSAAATPPGGAPKPDWRALEEGSPGGAVQLALRELEVEHLLVLVGPEPGARRIELDELTLQEPRARAPGRAWLRGEMDGGRFQLEGRVGPAAALTDPSLAWDFELEGLALGADWHLKGSLQEPFALRGLEIASLRVRGNGSEGHLAGRVADARAFAGVDLTLQAKLTDEALLQRWLGHELPPLDALDLDGSLSDADGSLGFAGTLKATARGGGAVLELAGLHDDLSNPAHLDARFTLKAHDLGSLLHAAGRDLAVPDLAPLRAEGRLSGTGGHLGVRDVTLDAGSRGGLELHAHGAVADLPDVEGVEAEAELSAPDAGVLADWLGHPLPATGPLHGSLTLSDADGSLGIERFQVSNTAAGAKAAKGFKVSLDAVVDDLRHASEVTVDARVAAPGLDQLGDLIGVGLPAVGPAQWNGRLSGSARSLAADGTLRVGGSTIEGKGRWQREPGGRGDLRLAVRSPLLRIADLGISPEGWAAQGKDRFAWAHSALPLELLRDFDATLTLDAGRLVGQGGFAVDDVHADTDLRGGVFSIGYRSRRGSSSTSLVFSGDVHRETPDWALRLESKGFDLTVPAAQVGREPHFSGRLDLDLELQARGRTADAVRRSLSGHARVTGRDGTFASRYSRAFIQSLLTTILKAGWEKPSERYRCLAGDFSIEDGVLEPRQLFVALPGMVLAGSGSIDVADGHWDLRIRPRIYGPGLIGGGATVEVRGPLDKPRFRPLVLSVPINIGETLAARILSPLQLAARPLTGTSDPCEGIP